MDGQKIWTSHARACDFGLALVRSEPDKPRHVGLSMVIVAMRQPGVTVRPLRQMTGEADFNEVFLDQAHVDPADLIGEHGAGWAAARVSLMNERASLGAGPDSLSRVTHADVLQVATRAGLDHDDAVRARLGELYLRERAVGLLTERIRKQQRAGLDPGPIASVAKLAKSALSRRSAELAFELGGVDAVAAPADADGAGWLADMLSRSRIGGIAGGTDEIQHNIVGERMLGLPRDRH